MTACANANGAEVGMGFRDDRDSAAGSGRGLLIDFFDQPAFNELTRNFRYAGGASRLCRQFAGVRDRTTLAGIRR